MTRPIRFEESVLDRSTVRGLLSTVALRTDQKSWDGELVPAGASGTIVEVLKGGEAYVVDIAEPFDAIVTVRAPELDDIDGR
ncbi:MAG: DUF4926 domain-containing protein [Methylorubrum populi]